VRRPALLFLFLFLSVVATSVKDEPVTLEAFVTPIVEGFEGSIDPGQQRPVGIAPLGLGFASGVIFAGPERGIPGVVPFSVAEFLAVPPGEPFGYDLGSNGFIGSPMDLHGGTAFAASPEPPTHPYLFQLPVLVPRVGLYVSAFDGAPVTLTILDELRGLIEAVSFASAMAPLDEDNFIALESEGPPIGFVSIESDRNFVIDDIVFDIPEPGAARLSSAALLCLAWLARARRDRPGV